ncbi:hypothetical protein RRG08_063608 [Elysia crispata]|uniref:Uncharacterized protein n=1 Tax=Elysia crispata TaxID=231223 RepID=A0AAE1AI73_9GAST|nr:hypothetical protein RRG08_063608 [Elysia crispata]
MHLQPRIILRVPELQWREPMVANLGRPEKKAKIRVLQAPLKIDRQQQQQQKQHQQHGECVHLAVLSVWRWRDDDRRMGLTPAAATTALSVSAADSATLSITVTATASPSAGRGRNDRSCKLCPEHEEGNPTDTHNELDNGQCSQTDRKLGHRTALTG